MSAAIDDTVRQQLLQSPDLILGDRDLMRALIGAREAENGRNVVDIRGRAMEALEERLTRLEAAHEGVIAAAYDNQSGMKTIHRAVVSLLEPDDFASFLENLGDNVAAILRVDRLRLVMESAQPPEQPDEDTVLMMVAAGTVQGLISAGRRAPRGDDIVLRRAAADTMAFHGAGESRVRSEALIPLDLGPGRYPALLLLGASDPGRFTPTQGTDLLRFFSQVFRLVLLGWLRG